MQLNVGDIISPDNPPTTLGEISLFIFFKNGDRGFLTANIFADSKVVYCKGKLVGYVIKANTVARIKLLDEYYGENDTGPWADWSGGGGMLEAHRKFTVGTCVRRGFIENPRVTTLLPGTLIVESQIDSGWFGTTEKKIPRGIVLGTNDKGAFFIDLVNVFTGGIYQLCDGVEHYYDEILYHYAVAPNLLGFYQLDEQ